MQAEQRGARVERHGDVRLVEYHLNGATMNDHSAKLTEEAAPFLENGESVLAAIMAAPKGSVSAHAGGAGGQLSTSFVRGMGKRAVNRELSAAEQGGIRIVAGQMGIILTPRRLLVLDLGTTTINKEPEVKELLSAIPLGNIVAIEGKRSGILGVLAITPSVGGEVKLQCQAKPAREFAEAFDRAKAAS
jgi:hypothetical protein